MRDSPATMDRVGHMQQVKLNRGRRLSFVVNGMALHAEKAVWEKQTALSTTWTYAWEPKATRAHVPPQLAALCWSKAAPSRQTRATSMLGRHAWLIGSLAHWLIGPLGILYYRWMTLG